MSNLTKAFIESCSDEQINKGVAWLAIKEWGAGSNHKRKSLDYYCSQGLLNSIAAGNVNYCTNPNDAWPIMMANKIGVEPPEKGVIHKKWLAGVGYNSYEDYDIEYEYENPLRAAMIVYLIMETQS